MNSLNQYQELHQKLLKIFEKTEQTLKPNQSLIDQSQFDKIFTQLKEDRFKVGVIGTFKSGKSTFLNALLGAKILPSGIAPCTGFFTEIKYGEVLKATLYFQNPLPPKLYSNIPENVQNHIILHNNSNIPPLDVDIKDLGKYLKIPSNSQKNETFPYQKLVLFSPLPLLKNKVELIDTPGIDEDEFRTKMVIDFLSDVDVVVYILDGFKIASDSETQFIETELFQRQIKKIFFVVSKFEQSDEDDISGLDDIKTIVQKKFPNQDSFFVSGQNALQGKLKKDERLFQSSFFENFENYLHNFLTSNKGQIIISSSLKFIFNFLGNEIIKQYIPNQKILINTGLEDLKKNLFESGSEFSQIQLLESTATTELSGFLSVSINTSKENISNFFNGLHQRVCDELELKLSSLDPKNIHSQAETIAKKIRLLIRNDTETFIREVMSSDIERFHEECESKALEFSSQIQDLINVIREQHFSLSPDTQKDLRQLHFHFEYEVKSEKNFSHSSVAAFSVGSWVTAGILTTILGPIGLITFPIIAFGIWLIGHFFSQQKITKTENNVREESEKVIKTLQENIKSQVQKIQTDHVQSLIDSIKRKRTILEAQINKQIQEKESSNNHMNQELEDFEEKIKTIINRLEKFTSSFNNAFLKH